MDYIHTLLIMEDDLDKETDSFSSQNIPAVLAERSELQTDIDPHQTIQALPQMESVPTQPEPTQPETELPNSRNTQNSAIDWCVCGHCHPMPQTIENKCCKQKNCITLTTRFSKLCLDVDVLELCLRNTREIRNDREDNSTRSFRKAASRQFILARHGYLGKGNRRGCPSCVVIKIRQKFPSITGVYMGYREH